jgi:hypothetical protein
MSNTNALLDFDVIITETLQKLVTVSATSRVEAEEKVEKDWKQGEYILDADDFKGVEFTASRAGMELARDSRQSEKGDILDMAKGETGKNPSVTDAQRLTENGHVKELLAILGDNGKDTSGLTALLGHINDMESYIKRTENTIVNMKAQLDSIKEIQDHPIKSMLNNTVALLERKLAVMKEQIAKLKTKVIGGCKDAVATFKEKGISALTDLFKFFSIKEELKWWSNDLTASIRADNKAIAKIEAFSAEYHKAGRNIANMARVAVGLETKDDVKKNGKLAQTLAEPFKVHKARMSGIKSSVDRIISSLDKLEQRRIERSLEKKPSIIKKLEDNKERVVQKKLETTLPERAKAQGLTV